mgnify:CR=1 FL=1
MIPARSNKSGFTLAETLVALLILAMLSAAGTSLLLGATLSSKQLNAQEAEARQTDIAQALIRNDIAALSVRGVLPDSGLGGPGNLFGQSDDLRDPILRFIRSGWVDASLGAQRSTLQYVEYRLEDGALVRAVTVRPDASTGTPVAERVLFENVDRVELQFFRDSVMSRDWIGDAGQPLDVLPELIELDIVFEDERVLTIAALTGGRT